MSLAPVPQHCPTPAELDGLELLVSGALGEMDSFNQLGSAITLQLPELTNAQALAAGSVEILDPEGLSLAEVSWPGGQVKALAPAQFGPFRDLALTVPRYRQAHAGRTVVPVRAPLTAAQVDMLSGIGPLTLLVFTGKGSSWLSPVALVKAARAVATALPDAVVVTTPVPSRGDPAVDQAIGSMVVQTFAGDDPVHNVEEDRSGVYPGDVQSVIDQDRPAPESQGLVVFFTGLSGSGKSTLARALVDRLFERGERAVTSLDGDVVRRNLSAGLTFSKADRETNIRRIGWVAAEISRHRGLAVVSPIAPFDETRQQVRQMVEEAGGAFFLVHVATPLEECERRDRKGLYAKARRGEISEFTGISSPYEEPHDADVRVDTTGRTIDDALQDVLIGLRDAGFVDLTGEGGFETVASATSSTSDSAVNALKVLFVCTANICRSPSMELLARHASPDESRVVFSSAGTHGFVDHPMDETLRQALPQEIDGTQFRSQRLTSQLLAEADLVLTAETAHRTFILDDHPAMVRKVFTLGQFAQSLDKAPSGLDRDALLAHLGSARGNADLSLDVPDPYRRGEEAAAGCVASLQDLLRAVVPALS